MNLPVATNPLLRIPRSLTAPDAWISILLASYLQYKQYTRTRQEQKRNGKVHAGAKSRPKRNAVWSLVHECIFTNLQMMVSPFANQASDMNAEMVDLQNEKDMNAYVNKVASEGKAPKKKSKNKGGGGDGKQGKSTEVRSRRIIRGELVYNAYYPVFESTLNLALSVIVGLVSRWILGVIRSLRLSLATSNWGPCCSPYRGTDDEGTRLPGSFERLLACVLIKQEGDTAGTLLFSLLLMVFFVKIMKMAWDVSSPSTAKLDGESEADIKRKKDETDTTPRRIHPRKVKRFIVGVGATLISLWIFHTPALLRVFGLDGLTEAAEEWGARVLLFGNLLGVISLPETYPSEEPSGSLQTLMNVFLLILALTWGYIASGMMHPIEETARNAAHILSPSPKKKMNPNEMMDLINVRMMLIIQAMAPIIVMCTYLFNTRFAETTKIPAGGGHMTTTFSKQYLQNSGLFVRVALSWCFVAVSSYTFRSMLQSYLDQASTVASAMATLGEGIANNDVNVGKGARNKRTLPPTKEVDPFHDRYQKIVLTAGRVSSFPAFVLVILAAAHLRGGDGSTHPGVGYESQPKDAPRSNLLGVKGLLPPYGDKCMSWIANQSNKPHQGESVSGDELLYAAALSQSLWEPTPFRDSAHKKVVNLFGRNKFCYPPETRSVKAVGRHVNFLLDSDSGSDDTDEGSILTMNALTGRELLDASPPIPVTLADILMGSNPAEKMTNLLLVLESLLDVWMGSVVSSGEGSCEEDTSKECKTSDEGVYKPQYPSLSEMLSSLVSHNFFTPTIVFPIIDTVAFFGSVWWNYWYSAKMIVYWVRLRGAASLRISA